MCDRPDEPSIVPVGVVHAPFASLEDAPYQGFADDSESEIEVFEEYAGTLAGIDEVIRVTVVYWAHLADRAQPGDIEGVFTRRTPHRPNPLSICTCMVLGVDDRRLHVRGLDAVDGSPVVDIKPALQAER